MHAAPTLAIDVSFDLVCPWCLIGKRHLETAIAQLRTEQPDVAVAVEWRSVPLIPGTPLEGLPYREFYVARLGSPAAVAARQAQVIAAGEQAGLSLALTRIETFPNTLLAHRLVRYAREQVGACAASDLVENLFARYFLRAEDIGNAQVLRQALMECGIGTPGGEGEQLQHVLEWLPLLPAPPLRSDAGVPHFAFDASFGVSGAQSPAVLLQAMRRALAPRAAAA